MTKRLQIPTEAHIRMTLAMLNSPAWIALDPCAKVLWTDLRAKVKSTQNGNISASLSELRQRGWKSSATLSKSLKQLLALGLLIKTRSSIGVEKGSKVCNLFRFTDLESHQWERLGIPAFRATNEWKKFQNLKDAERAILIALKRNISIQKLNRYEAKIEAQRTEIGTTIEVTPTYTPSDSESILFM